MTDYLSAELMPSSFVKGEEVAVADSGDLHLVLRLRALRGSRTLTALAAEVGIRADELGRIERGETSQVRWATLLRIIVATGGRIDDVLRITRDDESEDTPSWAAPLAALRDGRVTAGLPRRPDPDAIEPFHMPSDEAVRSRFVETDDADRVRRSPFRPAT